VVEEVQTVSLEMLARSVLLEVAGVETVAPERAVLPLLFLRASVVVEETGGTQLVRT
jgi:hypothetical protein